MKKYRVGTRGSKLALTQTKKLLKDIKLKNPSIDFEICVIDTAGDCDKETCLEKIKNKNFFTDAIHDALIENKIDLAVHSMKDLPSAIPSGLELANVPAREDLRDVLILKKGYNSINELPKNAKIATSSLRRKTLLKELRDDLDILSIRGNVDERIKKIETEKLDGILLAAAGVKRLGLEEHITTYLDEKEFIPAPAQGILAIQIRENDKELKNVVNLVKDYNANIQYKSERHFHKLAEDNFKIIASACIVEENNFTLHGMLGCDKKYIKKSIKGKVGEEKIVAQKLYEKISEVL